MKKNQNIVKSISIPWQATILGILNILGIFALLQIMLEVSSATNMSPISGGVLAGLLIFAVFLVLGIFQGQKWSIVVSICFSVIATFGSIFAGDFLSIILSLGINIFILYLGLFCVSHRFYNQKR